MDSFVDWDISLLEAEMADSGADAPLGALSADRPEDMTVLANLVSGQQDLSGPEWTPEAQSPQISHASTLAMLSTENDSFDFLNLDSRTPSDLNIRTFDGEDDDEDEEWGDDEWGDDWEEDYDEDAVDTILVTGTLIDGGDDDDEEEPWDDDSDSEDEYEHDEEEEESDDSTDDPTTIAVPTPTPPGGDPYAGFGELINLSWDFSWLIDGWLDISAILAAHEDGPEEDELPLEPVCIQHEEHARDAAAQAATIEINAFDSTVEHGTILVSRNGVVTYLEFIHGDGSQLPSGDLFDTIADAGYSMGEVVGYIHNHPESDEYDDRYSPEENERHNNATDSINRAPSNNDIDFAAFLGSQAVAQGFDLANWTDNFAIYIIDSEGTLREYDGVNGPTTPPTGITDEAADAAEEDAEGTCEA